MRKTSLLVALFAVATAACSGSSETPSATASASPSTNLPVQVAVANYELLQHKSNRFLVGLILPDNRMVAYGSIQMRFVGIGPSGEAGAPSQVVTGTYLPVPGTKPGDPNGSPQAISPSTARGVYELEGVRFGNSGKWAVEVAARVKDYGVVQGATTFDVISDPSVPGVGEAAIPSNNPVMGQHDVPLEAIDSRASISGEIPDPSLHQISIAQAIRKGVPAVVVFSTPVYCVSRFCGPVTDMIQQLQKQYGKQAAFIHIEIWQDFKAQVATESARDWLYRDSGLTEPWLFMVDQDGQIAARWDNVFTQPEVEDGLKQLLD